MRKHGRGRLRDRGKAWERPVTSGAIAKLALRRRHLRNANAIRGTCEQVSLAWAVGVGVQTTAEAATHATLTPAWASRVGEARRADGEGSSGAKLRPITVCRPALELRILQARKDTTGAGRGGVKGEAWRCETPLRLRVIPADMLKKKSRQESEKKESHQTNHLEGKFKENKVGLHDWYTPSKVNVPSIVPATTPLTTTIS